MNLSARKWRKINTWLTRFVITKIYGCKDISEWHCKWCGVKWDERCNKGCL